MERNYIHYERFTESKHVERITHTRKDSLEREVDRNVHFSLFLTYSAATSASSGVDVVAFFFGVFGGKVEHRIEYAS